MTYKFDYGDAVKVLPNAPCKYSAVGIGSVCGIYTIENEELAEHHGVPIGTVLYTVERKDGVAIEIPEQYLGACD